MINKYLTLYILYCYGINTFNGSKLLSSIANPKTITASLISTTEIIKTVIETVQTVSVYLFSVIAGVQTVIEMIKTITEIAKTHTEIIKTHTEIIKTVTEISKTITVFVYAITVFGMAAMVAPCSFIASLPFKNVITPYITLGDLRNSGNKRPYFFIVKIG